MGAHHSAQPVAENLASNVQKSPHGGSIMTLSSLFRFSGVLAFAGLLGIAPALADVSHVRVVRLSVAEGDVRFTRDTKGKDPLTDPGAQWETAPLNLPIRQGYTIATGNGRAEIEFESGALAFLSNNTALEFYDLSLEDGAKTTRLILRQGSAEFYVNPIAGDYFSVTGGDFSVEAAGKSRFRVNNFDDGSTVAVDLGRVNVLQKDGTTPLAKGQTLAVQAGDALSTSITKGGDLDDFDKWVSGRIDAFAQGTNASLQYGSGSYNAGFDDLYTYGSWFPVAGYGYGWRPYGAGFGWSPFDDGCWFFDPIFGWSFAGYQPWGWLPYHYGSWLFEPGFGWVWIPGAFGVGGPTLWRPVTATWVRNKGGIIGVVPIHPLDAKGKAPLNMSQGILPARGNGLGPVVQPASGERWKVLKSAPKQALASSLPVSRAPELISRSLFAGGPIARGAAPVHGPVVAFDPQARRFGNGVPSGTIRGGAVANSQMAGQTARSSNGAPMGVVNGANGSRMATARLNTPVNRTATPPSARISAPPAPRGGAASGGFGGGRSSPGGSFGGGRISGGGGASHPSGGGTSGGGRPH
jgi:hypothetical protein